MDLNPELSIKNKTFAFPFTSFNRKTKSHKTKKNTNNLIQTKKNTISQNEVSLRQIRIVFNLNHVCIFLKGVSTFKKNTNNLVLPRMAFKASSIHL